MANLYYTLPYTTRQVQNSVASTLDFNGSSIKDYIIQTHDDTVTYSGHNGSGIIGSNPIDIISPIYSLTLSGNSVSFIINNVTLSFPNGRVSGSYALRNNTIKFYNDLNNIVVNKTFTTNGYLLLLYNSSWTDGQIVSDQSQLTNNLIITQNYLPAGNIVDYMTDNNKPNTYYYNIEDNRSYLTNSSGVANETPFIYLGYKTSNSITAAFGLTLYPANIIADINQRLTRLENTCITI